MKPVSSKAKEGDLITNKKEFENIARKYSDTLYSHALVILQNKSDAEDAAEETLIKLLKRKIPFRDDDHVRAWLIRVVINESLMILRKRNRICPDEFEESMAGSVQFEYPEYGEVFDALNTLDVKYRSVLLLFYCDEMNVSETAKILGISKSAVTTRLSRARKLLKQELERRGYNG